jgi:hypothetical protein
MEADFSLPGLLVDSIPTKKIKKRIIWFSPYVLAADKSSMAG